MSLIQTTDIAILVNQINTQRPHIEKYNSFYHGVVKNTFMGNQLQHAYGKYIESLSVNRCGIVADAITNKMKIRGWEDEDASSDADELAANKWRQIEIEADQIHFDTIVSGNGWLLAWPNENNEIQVAAQDPTQISVRFNVETPNVIDVAAKTWQRGDGSWRLNLYYSDRLEKYATAGPHSEPPSNEAAWDQYSDEDDLAWPVIHQMQRVPIWHFRTNGRKGTLGISALAPIIPLQMSLNLHLAAQSVAVEHQAYAQRFATGIQVEEEIIRDDEGNETGRRAINPFQTGADAIMIAPDPDAKFGAFPTADINSLENLLSGDEKRIAITARIPLHLVMGSGDLSGEALKTSEKAFLDMLEDMQAKLGLVWSDLMRTILNIENNVPIEQRLIPRWIAAATRDESEHIKRVMNKVGIGISPQQALRELDYSSDQIEAFTEESEEWQRARQRLINEGVESGDYDVGN